MKRLLTVITAVLAFMLLFLVVTPVLLRAKAEKNIDENIKKYINGTVVRGKLSMSMFKRFPNLSIEVPNVIVMHGENANDTLLTVDNVSLWVKPVPALFRQQIVIKKCEVQLPRLSLLATDSVNRVPVFAPAKTQSGLLDGKLLNMPGIEELYIVNGDFIYCNEHRNISTEMNRINMHVKTVKNNDTTVLVVSSAGTVDLLKNNIRYIRDAYVGFAANITVDPEKYLFTLQQNEFTFNNLHLQTEGTVTKTDDGWDFDITTSGKDGEFESLFAFLPESLMLQYGMPETSGSFVFAAKVQGVANACRLPAFGIKMSAADGTIRYEGKSKSIDSISIDIAIDNRGGVIDSTIVNVSRFGFSIDGNATVAGFNVVTPVSNAGFRGNLNGVIDFSALREAIPHLADLELKGVVKSALSVEGDFAMLDSKDYNKLKSDGSIELNNFETVNNAFPAGLEISEARINLFPYFAQLALLKGKTGGSDFTLSGKLENYLSYLLKDGVLKGNLAHTSRFIDGNELMRIHASKENMGIDSARTVAPPQKTVIPDNLDIEINSRINRLVFNKLELNNTEGTLKIANSKLMLNSLKTQLPDGGTMTVHGTYTSALLAEPALDLTVQLNAIDVNRAAQSFSTVETMLPITRNATGTVSGSLKLKGAVDHGLTIIQNTLNGSGNLKSNRINIAESNAQKALAAFLKDDRYAKADISHLDVDFEIENGNIFVKPFEVDFSGKKIMFAGQQMLDRTIDFSMKIPVTDKEIGQFAGLLGKAIPAGDSFIVEILITGTSDDPELNLNIEGVKAQLEKKYENDIEKATKAVEKLLEDPAVKKKVEEVGNKLRKLFE